jgi:hypothetical protein
LATSAVWRCGSTSTLVTSSMRRVSPARKANSVKISWKGLSWTYGGPAKPGMVTFAKRSGWAPVT